MTELYAIHHLKEWAAVPYEEYLLCATSKPSGGGLERNPLLRSLIDDIRSLVPIPDPDLVHDIAVLIPPGSRDHQGQQRHAHREWAALFYPAGAETELCLEENDFTITRVKPAPGCLVILSPNVVHWVANHNGDADRLSFATLWTEQGAPSRFK